MTVKSSLAKLAALTVGVGTCLSLAQVGKAQAAPFRFKFVGGGSSALQGGYGSLPGPTGNYSPGAVPLLMATDPGAVLGFRIGGATVRALVGDSAVTVGGSGSATVEHFPCVVEYVFGADANPEGNGTNIIVLVRSDSGNGVRYVANKEVLKSITFPANSSVPLTGGAPVAPSAADTTVQNAITTALAAGPVKVETGFSDVTADSVIRYAGLGIPAISPAPTQQGLAVQTLLTLHNTSFGGATNAQINFTRSQFRSIIAGAPGSTGGAYQTNDVAPAQGAGDIVANARENSSGTRMTELLDIQLGITEGAFSAITRVTSTGAMLTAVNATANAVGYAFVTGTAGAGKTNTKVASYDGVNPLPSGTALPGSYASSPTPFYTPTQLGQYELWSLAQELTVSGSGQTSTANSIGALMISGTNTNYIHSLGLVQVGSTSGGFTDPGEMKVVRTIFTSPITGELVGDGQLITYDTTLSAVLATSTPINTLGIYQ